MATRDIIVIGASAGGVSALSTLVASLPADLPAAVFIVLHIPADSPSLLPIILSRNSALPVAPAESLSDGQSQMLEMALWSAVRAIEEQMMLARRILDRARKANHMRAAEMFERRAEEAERNSSVLRELLLGNGKGAIAEPVIRTSEEIIA